MKRLAPAVCFVVAAFVLPCFTSCKDGGTEPRPGRAPRAILVPDEMTLDEAGLAAVAGDTLLLTGFFPIPPLPQTMVITRAQTPLLILGQKAQPVITGTGDFPLVRFESPKLGTRVELVGFSGGSPAFEVTGSGAITVTGCRFAHGQVQVHGAGSGVTLEVTSCFFSAAGTFGIDAGATTHLKARRNTIVSAGDCGIRLTGSADGEVAANVIWRSANFGVACLDNATLTSASGCNDVFQSTNGAFSGCSASGSDFSVDPQFCDPDHGDYTVAEVSPCTPANSGGCDWVGAFGVGCQFPPIPTGPGPLPPGSR